MFTYCDNSAYSIIMYIIAADTKKGEFSCRDIA